MASGVEPPKELVEGILLGGKVHSIYAGSGTGKTFVMLGLILQLLNQGRRVIVFDLENGPRIMAERLQQLGADPKKLDRFLHYYYHSALPMTQEGLRNYEARLDEVKPDLVVFDSWIDFLAANGLDENSSTDIARWAQYYTHPARSREIAVLLLDHVPKDGISSRGSSRKKDEMDVVWSLSNPKPFDRDTVGEIVLRREKDREGWLPESVGFSLGGGVERFVFERSVGTIEEDDENGLTPGERKAWAVLEKFGEKGAKATEWQKAAEDVGVSRTTFYRSKKELLRKKHVLQVEDRFRVVGATGAKEVPWHQMAPGPSEGATGATTLGVAPGGTRAAHEDDEQLKQLLAEIKV
jgi:hypothetical protein